MENESLITVGYDAYGRSVKKTKTGSFTSMNNSEIGAILYSNDFIGTELGSGDFLFISK
jgi:hypothetical protein